METESEASGPVCPTCDGDGMVPDETACADEEHCHQFTLCPDCEGDGHV